MNYGAFIGKECSEEAVWSKKECKETYKAFAECECPTHRRGFVCGMCERYAGAKLIYVTTQFHGIDDEDLLCGRCWGNWQHRLGRKWKRHY